MKCGACGYEKGWTWNEEDVNIEVNPKGEDFIVMGEQIVKCKLYERDYVVRLYGCPECGTVRYEKE